MSNNYFQFKQFTIHQDQCAMKVSTDACIQGAWVQIPSTSKRVLDLGCGTGLLTLMLAQRYPNCTIDAIEIDEMASVQAKQNFDLSPYAKQINLIHADALSCNFETTYDFIICNPPFFSNSLQGPDTARNRARHQQELTLEKLVSLFQQLTNTAAEIGVLLPFDEFLKFEQLLLTQGWFVNRKLSIQPNSSKAPNRIVAICSSVNTNCKQEELIIYNKERTYTSAFIQLLSPYYLNL
jgi:tRNA1Val (adenine37-N6)-methyltransferase